MKIVWKIIAVLVVLGLLVTLIRAFNKYYFSRSVVKRMSELYPADKFRISGIKTYTNTFSEWLSPQFRIHSDNWQGTSATFWGRTYEVSVWSELLHLPVSVKGTGGQMGTYLSFRI